LTDEWIKKIRYINTIKYYSSIKMNEMMLFAGKWMEVEIIMLSKIIETKKNSCHVNLYPGAGEVGRKR
jgi:hypothetical protein